MKERLQKTPLVIAKIFVSLVLLVILGILGYYTYQTLQAKPYKVRVSNVTDSAFTVSWVTEEPTAGVVYYSEKDDFLPGPFAHIGKSQAVDDRDRANAQTECVSKFNKKASEEKGDNFTVDVKNYNCEEIEVVKKGKYYTHHVTVGNLDANKEYYFRVGNGFFNYAKGKEKDIEYANIEIPAIEEFSQKTLPIIKEIGAPNVAHGSTYTMYYDENKDLRKETDFDSFVFLQIVEEDDDTSPILSAVANREGGWTIDLGNLRNEDGTPIEELDGTTLRFIPQTKNFVPARPTSMVVGEAEFPLILIGNRVDEKEENEIIKGSLMQIFSKAVSAVSNTNTNTTDGGAGTLCPFGKSWLWREAKGDCENVCSDNGYSTQTICKQKGKDNDKDDIVVKAGESYDCWDEDGCDCLYDKKGANYVIRIPVSYGEKCSPQVLCSKGKKGSGKDDIQMGKLCVDPDGCECFSGSTYKNIKVSCGEVCQRGGDTPPPKPTPSCPNTGNRQINNKDTECLRDACTCTSAKAVKRDIVCHEFCLEEEKVDKCYKYNETGDCIPTAQGQKITTTQCSLLGGVQDINCNGLAKPQKEGCYRYNGQEPEKSCVPVACSGTIQWTYDKCEIERQKQELGNLNCAYYKDSHCEGVFYCQKIPDENIKNKTAYKNISACLKIHGDEELKCTANLTGGGYSICKKGNTVRECQNLINHSGYTEDPDKMCEVRGVTQNATGIEVTQTDTPNVNILNKISPFKAHAQTSNSDGNYMYYIPEDGVYILKLLDKEVKIVADSKTSYFFYYNRNGEEGYQEPEDLSNVKENEDLLVKAEVAVISISQKATAKKIELKEGINIVSFNFMPNSVDEPFSSSDFLELVNQTGNNVSRISYFSGGQWNGGTMYDFSTGETGGTSFELGFGKGYLIVAEQDTTITVPGYNIKNPVPIAFSSGWNLVGVHGYSKSYTAKSLITDINKIEGLKSNNVTYWPTSKGMYQGYQLSEGQSYGQDFSISKDLGYFVRISEFNAPDSTCKSIIWNPGGGLNGKCGSGN